MKHTYTNTTFDNTVDKISRVSWAAVFAGTLTAIVTILMLNLLGLGIGMTTIDPMTEADPLKGLGTGTIIWWVVSNFIALFLGGLVAGRMSGYPDKADGALHGFLSWGLYAVISVFIVTSSIGAAMNGMSNIVSGIFGGSDSKKVVVNLDKAQRRSQNNASFSYDKVKQEIFQLINTGERYNVLPDDASENTRQVLYNAKSQSRQAFRDLNLDKNIDEFFNDLSFDLDNNGNLDISLEGEQNYLNKQELKSYLVTNTNLTEAEINGLVNKWDGNIEQAVNKAEKYYAQAKQKAITYSDKAADAVGKYSIIAFIVFLLGAAAAYFGGMTGSPLLTVTEEHRDRDLEVEVERRRV